MHAERNPIFPEMQRPEPIPPNMDVGLAAGVANGADCVCIMDGDADRCGFGDENGDFIDQLRVFGLLGMYFLEVRGERGPIVKTLSTTSMLDKLGERFDVPVYQTGVGFKYIAPKMMEMDALIGGEESGGYAFRGHVPERDGILGNLFLLDLMVRTGLKPTQLLDRLFGMVGGPHYYDRIDTRLESNEFKARGQSPARRGPARDHRRPALHRQSHRRRLQVRAGRWRLAAGAFQRHRAPDSRLLRDHPRRQGPRYPGRRHETGGDWHKARTWQWLINKALSSASRLVSDEILPFDFPCP